MTTYTTIADADIDQDSPVTQPLMTALRDNPIAMAEGAAGAPKIRGEAALPISQLSVLTGVTAADTYTIDVGLDYTVGTLTTSSTSFVTAYTITVNLYSGTLRFKLSHREANNVGGVNSVLSITKNGVEQASWTRETSTAVERTADISVVPTDVIVWRHRVSAGTGISVVSGKEETASDAYTTVPLYAQASNL